MSNQETPDPAEISMKAPSVAADIPLDMTFSSTGLRDVLSQLISMSEERVVHEPTCRICRHQDRKEFEEAWINTKQEKAVNDLAEQKGEKKFASSTIQNHMLYHFDRGVHELRKIEYIATIDRINQTNSLTTLDHIRTCESVILERIVGINSLVPDQDTSAIEVEKIKSAESTKLLNALNQVLKLRATILGEMKKGGELLTVPYREFIAIFNEALTKAENDGQKKAINDLLTKLREISQNMQ